MPVGLYFVNPVRDIFLCRVGECVVYASKGTRVSNGVNPALQATYCRLQYSSPFGPNARFPATTRLGSLRRTGFSRAAGLGFCRAATLSFFRAATLSFFRTTGFTAFIRTAVFTAFIRTTVFTAFIRTALCRAARCLACRRGSFGL